MPPEVRRHIFLQIKNRLSPVFILLPQSGLCGSSYGAGFGTCAAFNAGFGIDFVFSVSFADGRNGAFGSTGAAADAFF